GTVIDVEKGSLRTLEHHALSRRELVVEPQRRIGDERLEADPDLSQIREHVLPLHLVVADQTIPRGDILAHRRSQRAIVRDVAKIADTDSATANLVLV